MKPVSNKTNKQSINTTYIEIISTATRFGYFNSHHWDVENNETFLHMNAILLRHVLSTYITHTHTHTQTVLP
jgi:hypothetical protein